MRIIAGKFGSRVLESLDGDNTRPTQDKIKEAIFSKIGPYFNGGLVLDIFGGSGALGLESISRGADFAYFADNNYKACKVIENNIKKLGLEKNTCVVKADYMSLLNQVNDKQFKVIFIDPPYALKVHHEILKYIDEHNMLLDNGVIVVETSNEDSFDDYEYQNFKIIKEKQYKITKITYFERR